MTSATTTRFKQKTCPKCKNNHDNEGVLCSFCIQKAEAALAKVQPTPPDFFVKCLIEREGNTTLNLGNIQYTFERNEKDDAVCEIINLGHYHQILKSDFYEAYVPTDEDEPAIDTEDTEDEDGDDAEGKDAFWTTADIDLIAFLIGEKHTVIAAALSEQRGEVISRQKVTKYLSL
jgi:hypothetical protein